MDEAQRHKPSDSGSRTLNLEPTKGPGHPVLGERTLCHLLTMERKRSDRSERGLLLALVNLQPLRNGAGQIDPVVIDAVFSSLSVALRETDLIGWYADQEVAAALLTEVRQEPDRDPSTVETVQTKLATALASALPADIGSQIRIEVFQYPSAVDGDGASGGSSADDDLFYPDLTRRPLGRRVEMGGKRLVDILGSASLLILLAPLLILIAAAIKLTSKGPVLFPQQRVGYRGRLFTFLKFRSMYEGADDSKHQEFITRYIDSGGPQESLCQQGIYKLKGDERVTPLGRWLRRTSLDELPQLINVLNGEMSLVGPRPPIPYEVDRYQAWHLRRVLEVRPGITGLWQVGGRNRTTFDEMVRLDLQYARRWSLWLDFVVLLRTPWAVLRGDAA